MKTILVAIDFSKNAEHALEYALVFAKKLDAEIKLIWVDNTVSDESVLDTIEGDLRREKKSYMNELIKIISTFGLFLLVFGIELIVVYFYFFITNKLANKKMKNLKKK